MPNVKVIAGDALAVLKELPAESVHCCVTSPPYWGLRDYGVPGQLGLEKTPEEYVGRMVEVFREVRRVLRSDGTCWVNMGDSYYNYRPGKGQSVSKQTLRESNGSSDFENCLRRGLRQEGIKEKDLCGIPWRVAFALQADGWWLRQDIIWAKPNPMPESVTDRCTKAHEYIFLLSKSARYFYDAEAIKEPNSEGAVERFGKNNRISIECRKYQGMDGESLNAAATKMPEWLSTGRNKRSVWTVPSAAYSEAHFATFPPDLIKPCILAGTSARGCCPKCGAPWERVLEKEPSTMNIRVRDNAKGIIAQKSGVDGKYKASPDEVQNYGPETMGTSKTIGWEPGCECGAPATVACTVLDPFAGSGTTGMVALELGRNGLLIELNPDYVKLIQERTHVTPGLLL